MGAKSLVKQHGMAFLIVQDDEENLRENPQLHAKEKKIHTGLERSASNEQNREEDEEDA